MTHFTIQIVKQPFSPIDLLLLIHIVSKFIPLKNKWYIFLLFKTIECILPQSLILVLYYTST